MDKAPFVMAMTEDTRDTVSKHKLSMDSYLDAMSRSDFFICPPGLLVPHSHNIAEAMSVGTIPITNYHDYMRPKLTGGQDCLSFNSLEELDEAVDRALAMTSEEVERLRKNVISYYKKYMDPVAFGEKIRSSSKLVEEIVVNDESGL